MKVVYLSRRVFYKNQCRLKILIPDGIVYYFSE